jgi:ribonuclease Z
VYERHGLKVTAFDVDHRPIKPALGYRVDYAGRSVVVSGDTRVSENLIRFADGADLLIHEVILADLARKLEPNKDLIERVIAHHTTAEQAGEVFARVKPKLAVYSHIAPPSATAAALKRAIRITYKGPLEVGEDLMVIEVGRTIKVTRHSQSGDVAKAVR